MPLVRMKAAPVKTDGERLGNEFMNGVFFSGHILLGGFGFAAPAPAKARARILAFKIRTFTWNMG